MNKDDLLKGALLCLANSASLLEAAASLYSEGHDPGSFVLVAVSAREELGRFALLAEKGGGLAPEDNVDPAALRKELNDHMRKLRASGTAVPVPMPQNWLEAWRRAIENRDRPSLEALRLRPQFEMAKRAVRKREPHDTRQRRLRSQYVDPETNGSWSTPDAIGPEYARVALLAAAAGIANTLTGIQSVKDLQAVAERFKLALPSMGDFTTRVFSRVAGNAGLTAAAPDGDRGRVWAGTIVSLRPAEGKPQFVTCFLQHNWRWAHSKKAKASHNARHLY